MTGAPTALGTSDLHRAGLRPGPVPFSHERRPVLLKPLVDAANEYKVWASDPTPRLGIGYPIMDSRTNGGAAKGEVILFQARSQVGKTTFALNVLNNIGGDHGALFFSLEMNARYLVPRLAAMHTNTPTSVIEAEMRSGVYSQAIAQTIQDFPFLALPDKPAMTIKEMHETIEEAEQRFGRKVEVVAIDFLELIGGAPSLSTVDKIDGLTRKIKDFARTHDVVVLLLHQVGRDSGGAGAEPLDLTSSRYGGEVSADYVLGAYRPCLRKGITQDQFLTERWHYYIQFLKTRGGSELHPEGLLHSMNPETMRIAEWDYAASAREQTLWGAA